MKAAPILCAALIAGLALPGTAFAHPKLLSATPADKATVSGVSQATLKFSEKLVGPVSGVDLLSTGKPGAPQAPSKVSGVKTALGADGKTLVATFPKALVPGSYKLDWHVVSTDTHRVTGSYAFTVR